MATTTNFGWETPDDTDLVKDGAAAIRTALGGVDTSFVDLKGGTTGQVLSKTSATDLDFTWVNQSGGATYLSGKNVILNSNFSVWQRGTSISLAASTAWANGYTADRWNLVTNANQACTVARQPTGDTTNLPFIQYCARVQRNSGQTGTTALNFVQALETINSVPFAGKTVSVSFYARKGSNYSATSNVLAYSLVSGTGTDQQPASYTGSATPISQNATLTATWQRFSYSAAVASTATELYIQFGFTPTGTASTNDYFEITGVQLEIASEASAFSPAATNAIHELAACQRYFVKTNNQSEVPGTAGSSSPINALNASTTLVVGVPPFKVSMRIAPSVTLYSSATGTSGKIRSGGADRDASAADIGEYSIGYISSSGLTSGSNSTITFAASAEI